MSKRTIDKKKFKPAKERNVISHKKGITASKKQSKPEQTRAILKVSDNVISITPQLLKSYRMRMWELEYKGFLSSLSKPELDLVMKSLCLFVECPKKPKPESSEIISFPTL